MKDLILLYLAISLTSIFGWADSDVKKGTDPEQGRRPRPKLKLNLEPSTTQRTGLVSLKNEGEVLQDRIWVDLAESQHYDLDERFRELIDLMDLYNKQEKTSPAHVFFRKELLRKIALFCEENLHIAEKGFKISSKFASKYHPALIQDLTEDDRMKLHLIYQTASNKLAYLDELKKIKKKTLEIIFPKPTSTVSHARVGKAFALENPEIRGRWELLEHLDPAMRNRELLIAYFQNWKKVLEVDKNTPSFFYWLEDQPISHLRTEPDVKSDLERISGTATRVVSFKDGKASSSFFATRNEKVYSPEQLQRWKEETSDPVTHNMVPSFERDDQKLGKNEVSSRLHYAIGSDGTLYIRYRSPYHSYILRGDPVLSSGFITFKDGKIDSISNESGHYIPSDEQLDHAISLLKQRYNDPENKIFTNTFRVIRHP